MSAATQPGPCVVCGLRNYSLSYGGPDICPGCDCGHTGESVVRAQRAEIERLTVYAELNAKLLLRARWALHYWMPDEMMVKPAEADAWDRDIKLTQEIDAALATNPNPSGRLTAEASSDPEASGPVGLGPIGGSANEFQMGALSDQRGAVPVLNPDNAGHSPPSEVSEDQREESRHGIAPTSADAWAELRAVEGEMKARGIRDVKFAWAPGMGAKAPSEVARDVARFLRAALDGPYTIIDKIGDAPEQSPAGKEPPPAMTREYQRGVRAAWDEINKVIRLGPLPYPDHEQRNGMVLASNVVSGLMGWPQAKYAEAFPIWHAGANNSGLTREQADEIAKSLAVNSSEPKA